MADPTPPSGDLSDIVNRIKDVEKRASALESPSGTQKYQTVEKLQALIDDIQQQLDDYIANDAYTKAQVDSLVASPGAIAPTDVTASGNVSAGGTLSSTGNATVGGQLRCLDAYSFDITYTRRTAWWGNDGRAGYASSSRDKKINIEPARLDADAFLTLEPKSFYYRAEFARRTQMRLDGTDLDYRPVREFGLMAQDVDAAGFGEFVYHDEKGNAEGIEYSMLVVPLLAVARQQAADIAELRDRLTALGG